MKSRWLCDRKESDSNGEREEISAVFHNRLKKRIPLQSDPTVIYGLPNYDGNIHKKDLLNPSPYNTYRIAGLPPGPIANPGIQSIRATLYPSNSRALYFVSKNDGTHQFSATLAEHNEAVEKYQKEAAKKSDASHVLHDVGQESYAMNQSDWNLPALIDHTILRPEATKADVLRLCREARQYAFTVIFIPPCYAADAVEAVAGSAVRVGIPIGFPLGGHATRIKVAEAVEGVRQGAVILDMVINVSRLKSGDIDAVRQDIAEVVRATPDAEHKVIRTCYLLIKKR
jgi:hypothetical protein